MNVRLCGGQRNSMANILAIVGRPNVGKSTLFNRLTKTRRAIVNDAAGTTRDRQYGKSEWCGKEFSVIDTGGWVVQSDDTFESEINRQVSMAIKEADVVLLVVDVNAGVTQFDMEVAHLLRQAKKETVLAVNKVDQFDQQYGAPEFYKLGLGEPYILSAENGLGTGDLLDEICSRFKDTGNEEVMEELKRIATIALQDTLISKNHDWNTIKNNVKSALSSYIYEGTHRKPMILPVIMEV